MVLRKFGTDIRDSIYTDFKTILSDWEIEEYFTIQQNFIKCNITGSYVRFRGLDESGKIKGLSGIRRIIMDEIDQFDEVDFKQIRKRLRGREGQQIIGLFNPISEEHWIKKNVFDHLELTYFDCGEYPVAEAKKTTSGNTVILRTNYLDNVFIVGRWKKGKLIGGFVDQHVIDDFERDKTTDYNYYTVYGLGMWGKIRTGGEFWKDFNSNIHTGDFDFNPDLPIHLTFDENVNPYITCLVWQLNGKKATQIDEICLEDPRNRIRHVCNEFIQRYPVAVVKGLFIYGDRTSWKEDTKKEKGENFFTDIVQQLSAYHPKLRLQSVNPSIVQSAGFINYQYAGHGDIEIRIASRCKKSINDYLYALEDSDGTLKKSRKTNPVTKVTYEEYGHPSDAKRYLLTMAYASEYASYIKGGRSVSIKTGKAHYENRY